MAAYASTLGLNAAGPSDYAGDEAHYLLAARSLAKQRALDVSDDYREHGYRDFDAARPAPEGRRTKGALNEPRAIGLPLLAAPVYALGGARAVELVVAALAALAGALAYLLGRRVVPDPWAAGAALAVGLSPPMLAHGTAVLPEPAAAAPLAGALWLTARMREHRPRRREAVPCFALLGTLPWFGIEFLVPGAVVAFAAVRTLRRAHRRFLALVSIEVALFGVALLVGLNEALFGGATPHAADTPGTSPTGAESVSDYLRRTHRAIALFLDRDAGLVRWAPVLALAFVGAWVLYRAGRERLARAIAGLAEEHGVARLCAGTFGAGLLVAVFLAPSLGGDYFPGGALVAVLPLTVPLVALGLRQAPRTGTLLALLTIAGSAWLWLDVRGGGSLLGDRPDAPWGPLVDAFPHFDGSAWPYVLAAAIAVAACAPFVREEIALRRRLP
jgi:hypothetical protein